LGSNVPLDIPVSAADAPRRSSKRPSLAPSTCHGRRVVLSDLARPATPRVGPPVGLMSAPFTSGPTSHANVQFGCPATRWSGRAHLGLFGRLRRATVMVGSRRRSKFREKQERDRRRPGRLRLVRGGSPEDDPPCARSITVAVVGEPRRQVGRTPAGRRLPCALRAAQQSRKRATRRRMQHSRRWRSSPDLRRCTCSQARSARRDGATRAARWPGSSRPSLRRGDRVRCPTRLR
jgi:hypothetical protein